MRYVNNQIRQAVVTDVNNEEGKVQIRFLDQISNDAPEIPAPHPYASSSGEGIFVGPKPGTNLSVGMMSYERYIPIGTVPIKDVYGDLLGTEESDIEDISYPYLEAGDIVLQGRKGGQIRLDSSGDVSLYNGFNEGVIISGTENSSHRCAIKTSAPVEYNVSESGIKVSGRVRRDVKIEDGDESYIDFLMDVKSESVLEEIGRNPKFQIGHVSKKNKNDESIFRNPSFVEDRKLVLEFGREWNVRTYDEELSMLKEDLIPISYSDERIERRTDVLNLNHANPNSLIEVITGTLVDVFGNILDINRNIIDSPEGDSEEDLLKSIYEKVRHSVAYHMEINTKKGYGYREGKSNTKKPTLLNDPAKTLLTTANNSRDRSRWSTTIDKEGLTLVNIPSTSETGNVPVLARKENSSVLDIDEQGNPTGDERQGLQVRELHRNEKAQDIYLDQVGPGGIEIKGKNIVNRLQGKTTSWVEGSQKTLSQTIQAGTAFHDITKTALNILKENINKKASDIFDDSLVEEGEPAILSELIVNPPIDDVSIAERDPKTGLVLNQPNAGGRSVSINLDGSLESSIGADTANRVSWTLDTAGAIVARLGRDRQGRSAIVQTDGEVVLELGGWDILGDSSTDEVDTRFVGRGDARSDSLPGDPTIFRNGKLVIRVRRSNNDGSGPDEDNQDHLLIFDETGITVESVGRLNLKSEMDMTIQSKGQLILDGEVIRLFENNSRYITRSGRRIA